MTIELRITHGGGGKETKEEQFSSFFFQPLFSRLFKVANFPLFSRFFVLALRLQKAASASFSRLLLFGTFLNRGWMVEEEEDGGVGRRHQLVCRSNTSLLSEKEEEFKGRERESSIYLSVSFCCLTLLSLLKLWCFSAAANISLNQVCQWKKKKKKIDANQTTEEREREREKRGRREKERRRFT